MVDAKDCLFCRIIAGDIPSQKVYEDTNSIAFLDINPRNPGHTLLVPKKHVETIFDLPEGEGSKLFAALKKVAVLVKNGTQAHGLSVCQNNGSASGQVVAHVYFHLIPRFLNEGPPALENMLPIKKMDEKSLQKIASAIKGAPTTAPKKEAPAPTAAKNEASIPKAKPEKRPAKEEEEDVDEFEEIDFNL